jgi:hypothetical protein
MKTYRVHFDIKANKKEYSIYKDVEAANKAAARKIVEDAWHKLSKKHMFHTEVRCVNQIESANFAEQ